MKFLADYWQFLFVWLPLGLALLIVGTWRIARGHFAREWDRKIAPAVEAKGRAQGYLDGERKGYTAGQIAMVKRYAAMTADRTAMRVVDAVTHRN